MKKQVSLLALCLSGAVSVYAQTTNSSTTTTNSTYSTTTPTTTNSTYGATNTSTDGTSTGTMNNGTVNTTSPMNTNYGTGSTLNNSTTTGTTTDGMNNGTMGTTNNGTSTTYGTTTTTTTNTYGTDANTRTDRDRPWGKEGKFGVYAGVNFSRFVNEPIPDGAFRAGWQAGIYGRTGGTIFGQLGVEYRNSTANLVRNGTGQPTQTPGEIRGQINQHMVAVPAYVGVRIGSALGLRLQAGAELSALVVNNPNERFGIGTDDFRRTMFNGLLGAGINLGPLTLDAAYSHGLTQVFAGNDTRRNILMFNLGFRF